MKTNLVMKGSEKNIEMFEMSNEELVMVNGGGEGVIYVQPGQKPVIIIRSGVMNFSSSYHREY